MFKWWDEGSYKHGFESLKITQNPISRLWFKILWTKRRKIAMIEFS